MSISPTALLRFEPPYEPFRRLTVPLTGTAFASASTAQLPEPPIEEQHWPRDGATAWAVSVINRRASKRKRRLARCQARLTCTHGHGACTYGAWQLIHDPASARESLDPIGRARPLPA